MSRRNQAALARASLEVDDDLVASAVVLLLRTVAAHSLLANFGVRPEPQAGIRSYFSTREARTVWPGMTIGGTLVHGEISGPPKALPERSQGPGDGTDDPGPMRD